MDMQCTVLLVSKANAGFQASIVVVAMLCSAHSDVRILMLTCLADLQRH